MIKIVAKVLVKEGMTEAFKEAAKELVAKSAAEEGNISYSLNVSVQDPRSFAFIEIWKDKEAIESHNASPHFTGAIPKLSQMAEAPMAVEVYSEVAF